MPKTRNVTPRSQLFFQILFLTSFSWFHSNLKRTILQEFPIRQSPSDQLKGQRPAAPAFISLVLRGYKLYPGSSIFLILALRQSLHIFHRWQIIGSLGGRDYRMAKLRLQFVASGLGHTAAFLCHFHALLVALRILLL